MIKLKEEYLKYKIGYKHLNKTCNTINSGMFYFGGNGDKKMIVFDFDDTLTNIHMTYDISERFKDIKVRSEYVGKFNENVAIEYKYNEKKCELLADQSFVDRLTDFKKNGN